VIDVRNPPVRRRGRIDSTDLVNAARVLLVTGGPEAVTVREVARALEVVPSALYRHVAGRDDLLTTLVAALYRELASVCVTARDAEPAAQHLRRLVATSEAVHGWARSNPAEFDLLFGYPVQGYQAPEQGPTDEAGREFGAVFLAVFDAARRDGRLRARDPRGLPGDVAEQLARLGGGGFELDPGDMYPIVMGLQRLLGLIAVEIAGTLRWAIEDATALTSEQIERLAEEIVGPDPRPRSARRRP
jgi:AcrR family transcriptional regulator